MATARTIDIALLRSSGTTRDYSNLSVIIAWFRRPGRCRLDEKRRGGARL